jgi:hypothetical protein
MLIGTKKCDKRLENIVDARWNVLGCSLATILASNHLFCANLLVRTSFPHTCSTLSGRLVPKPSFFDVVILGVCLISDGSCSLQPEISNYSLSNPVTLCLQCSFNLISHFPQISLGTDWFCIFQEAMVGHFASISLEHKNHKCFCPCHNPEIQIPALV